MLKFLLGLGTETTLLHLRKYPKKSLYCCQKCECGNVEMVRIANTNLNVFMVYRTLYFGDIAAVTDNFCLFCHFFDRIF